jgi:hypothetical protein
MRQPANLQTNNQVMLLVNACCCTAAGASQPEYADCDSPIEYADCDSPIEYADCDSPIELDLSQQQHAYVGVHEKHQANQSPDIPEGRQ